MIHRLFFAVVLLGCTGITVGAVPAVYNALTVGRRCGYRYATTLAVLYAAAGLLGTVPLVSLVLVGITLEAGFVALPCFALITVAAVLQARSYRQSLRDVARRWPFDPNGHRRS